MLLHIETFLTKKNNIFLICYFIGIVILLINFNYFIFLALSFCRQCTGPFGGGAHSIYIISNSSFHNTNRFSTSFHLCKSLFHLCKFHWCNSIFTLWRSVFHCKQIFQFWKSTLQWRRLHFTIMQLNYVHSS